MLWNSVILERFNEATQIINRRKMRELEYFGHIMKVLNTDYYKISCKKNCGKTRSTNICMVEELETLVCRGYKHVFKMASIKFKIAMIITNVLKEQGI